MRVENGLTPEMALMFESGEQYALDVIGQRFDGFRDYHNTLHTSRGIEKTGQILTVMNRVDPTLVSKRDIHRGRLRTAFHDIVQNARIVPRHFGSLVIDTIKQDSKNEFNSANEELNYMITQGFPYDDMVGVYQDTACTVAEPDPDFPGSFYQPHLSVHQSFLGMAVALADLGCAGMEGPDRFHEDGTALFREQFIGVRDLLKQGGLTTQQEKDLKDFMLIWLEGQTGFTKGRQKRTAIEIGMLPEDMRGPIWELFHHFRDSISMTEKNHRLAQSWSLSELATFFGYNADGTLFA